MATRTRKKRINDTKVPKRGKGDLRNPANAEGSITGTSARHKAGLTAAKDVLGQGLKEVLAHEEVSLLKDMLRNPGKKDGYPRADVLSRYTPNAIAIIGNLVNMAGGGLIQTINDLDLTPNQKAQHLNTAAKTTLDAIKVCYNYVSGRPKELKGDEGDGSRPTEVVVLNVDVPDVPLPLPENEK